MNYGVDERRGQMLLGAILAGYLVIDGISPLVMSPVQGPALPLYALSMIAGLLPSLALFWALWRGCKAALVVFVIRTVTMLGDVVGLFQFGSFAALPAATVTLTLAQLLLRLTVVLCIFQHDQVGRYWQARQALRRRKDLVLELILLAAAVALSLLPYLFYLFHS